MRLIWTCFALALVACVVAIALIIASAAQARENTLGLPQGFGHPANHAEYFDGDCCSNSDCEMVPNEAVHTVEGGWKVRYWTEKYGGMVVDGFVPFGNQRASKKCLKGACMGVCSYPQKKTNEGTGTFGSDIPDYSKPAFVRCLYVMPET